MEHYCVPGPVPSTFTSSHLILPATPLDRYSGISILKMGRLKPEDGKRLAKRKRSRARIWTQVIQSLGSLEPSPDLGAHDPPRAKALSPALCQLPSALDAGIAALPRAQFVRDKMDSWVRVAIRPRPHLRCPSQAQPLEVGK